MLKDNKLSLILYNNQNKCKLFKPRTHTHIHTRAHTSSLTLTCPGIPSELRYTCWQCKRGHGDINCVVCIPRHPVANEAELLQSGINRESRGQGQVLALDVYLEASEVSSWHWVLPTQRGVLVCRCQAKRVWFWH